VRIRANSLYFSLIPGKGHHETSSQVTASSAGESAANCQLNAISHKASQFSNGELWAHAQILSSRTARVVTRKPESKPQAEDRLFVEIKRPPRLQIRSGLIRQLSNSH
jgi:hypothetical protein